MTNKRSLVPALLLLLCGFDRLPAAAEVVSAGEGGFVVRNDVSIAASPAEVWAELIQVRRWWHPDHTFSSDADRLSIDPRPGGCFCEELPGGGGVRHLEVVYVDVGRLLRLEGSLGPLQGTGVSGAMSWVLESADDGEATTVELLYSVHGYQEGGLGSWSAPVDQVLRQQLERLERRIETGSPDAG